MGLVAASALVSGCAGLTLPWRSTSAALTATGTLEADERVVSARVSGMIIALPAEEGTEVRAGDVVARLDDRLVQLGIRQAPDTATRLNLEMQSQDYVLSAPVSGVVTRVPAHVGEMAFPGQALLAIADLSELDLTIYLDEVDLARVRVGQTVRLAADPYPGRVFEGTVASINQQAEFTPRNVQTRTDRLNLVFGVKAKVANPDGALKPGMPVDATFVEDAPPR
ncbi:MAG: efflux RND transporter periplasmic adaptor subunit [Dehalococcoidia bacterium]